MKQKNRKASVEVFAPSDPATSGIQRKQKVQKAEVLPERKPLDQIVHLHDRGTDRLIAALRALE